MKELNETEKFVLCYLCLHVGVRYGTVLQTRKRERVEVRQVFMKWLKEARGHSLKAIAKKLGLDDHTTVLHGIRNTEVVFIEKPKLKEAYETVSVRYRSVP